MEKLKKKVEVKAHTKECIINSLDTVTSKWNLHKGSQTEFTLLA